MRSRLNSEISYQAQQRKNKEHKDIITQENQWNESFQGKNLGGLDLTILKKFTNRELKFL